MSNLIMGLGKLGKEIHKQTNWDYITRSKNRFDFKDINTYIGYIYSYETLINCIANTNTYSENYSSIIDTNFKAIVPLVNYCNQRGIKLVQISTDYVYSESIENATEEDVPVHARNWYSYSKLMADGFIKEFCDDYLIIRTSFKPKPFPYEKAFTKQIGNFDYTDVIAKLIIRLINKKATGVFNVGTEIKSIYDLAKQTRKDVEPLEEFISESTPSTITMNLTKMKNFLGEECNED